MKYCKKCGKELLDDAAFCSACGTACGSLPAKPAEEAKDGRSLTYAAAGFFLPVIGLVLYVIEQDKMPRRAKSALRGAICGIAAGILGTVLFTVLKLAILFL